MEMDRPVWRQNLGRDVLEDFLAGEECGKQFYLRFINDSMFEWHQAFVERLDEYRLLITSKNIQKEILNRAIGKAVEREFDYVAYISIKDGSYMLHYSGNEKMPPLFDSDYEKILEDYNTEYVVEDENKCLTDNMRIRHVISMLESREKAVKAAKSAAERFFERLKTLRWNGMQITSSMGIFVGTAALPFAEFYQKADQALYEMKSSGKNAYVLKVDDLRE